jgi:lysophospholipase L1-like esterase
MMDEARVYQRRLDDAEIAGLAGVTPANQPPTVNAGPDQSIALGATANLDGTVGDDGLPTNILTSAWSKFSGPGTVTFGNSNAVDTTASFSATGEYVLRLTANDSQFSASDDLMVTVTNPPPSAAFNGHWPFDDGSGTTAIDATGKGHTAMLLNGVGWTAAGRIGGAVNLDGTDDQLQIADAADLEMAGQSFTVALWIKTTRTSSQMLVEKQNTGFAGELLLALNRDNVVPGGFSIWTGSQWYDSVGRGLTDGQWHHLAVSFTNGTFRLYRDGALDRTVSAAGNYVNSSLPWNVGRFVAGGIGWYFAGMLDDLRIYQRALSDAEISGLVGVSPVNQPPNVNAGADQSIAFGATATLDATVTDDALPGGTLTTSWSKLSGPGTVTFGNSNTVDTTATFSASGVYVLRLTGSDGQLSASDDVTVTVNSGGGGTLVKVMPLGDSITDGFSIPGGYRIELWNRFLTNGQSVDFVGSLMNGPGSLGDRDHEGHSGARIDEMAAAVNPWLVTFQPDIILLLIGANDVVQNFQLATATNRLSALMDQIVAARSNSYLVVASLTPFSDGVLNQRAVDINVAIPGIVHSQVAQGRKVSFVDMYAALTPADLLDGVHPSAAGFAKMAPVWHDVITKILSGGAAPVNNPPSVLLTNPVDTAVFTAPATVTFQAAAQDADGTISKVEFYQHATKVGEDTTAPFSFTWTNVPAGFYKLTARATDDDGAVTVSPAVNISVMGGGSSDLKGHWPLNEGSGTTAMDASGNGHHATLLNGVAWTASGRDGGAVTLDGVNDQLQVPDSTELELAGRSFTVALWVKTTRTPAQMLIERQHTSFSGEFLFALNRDNVVPGGFSIWTGGAWIDSVGRGLTDGQWHHLAVTYEAGTFRLYRDGVLDRTQAATATYVDATPPWNIGRFLAGGVGWPFGGMLDEIRIYWRALAGSEINMLFTDPGGVAGAPAASMEFSGAGEFGASVSGSGSGSAGGGYVLMSLPAHGLLTDFDPVTGAFSYRPAHGFAGLDRFELIAPSGLPTVVTLMVAAPEDTDANGLPDQWAATHGINDPEGDADGDRLSNLQEYLAQTDPNDPRSTVRITSVTVNAAGHIQLLWPAVGGVRYRVQCSDGVGRNTPFRDILRSAAEEIDPSPPAAASTRGFTDDFTLTGGAPLKGVRCYRIEVVR